LAPGGRPRHTLLMAGFRNPFGADMRTGDEHAIAQRLGALANALHLDLYPVGPHSGYRSPSESLLPSVGGTANDPHTKGQAVDLNPAIVNVPESTLNKYGLTRPMTTWRSPTDGRVHDERNHIQILPQSAGKSVMQANTASSNTGATAGATAGKLIGGIVGPGGAASGGAAGGAIGSVADSGVPSPGEIANGIVNSLWGAAAPKASYAGLFVLMVAAGAWLAVQGLKKSTSPTSADG
jgi:hypothetical protein